MRIDQRQVSGQRPAGPPPGTSWGPAADAPTFLPSDELVLSPRAATSDSIVTSAPKPKPAPVRTRAASQSTIKPAPASAAPAGPQIFDPLAIPLPPELAPPIYGWLRRLALQADLAGADRLLRDAVADLT
ncbi:MAG TPA: hypothetical protein VFS15_03035, partial [Kofleriaceae bacterium]|nr:hypothetical protein [Kofleriaceae bacterium]